MPEEATVGTAAPAEGGTASPATTGGMFDSIKLPGSANPSQATDTKSESETGKERQGDKPVADKAERPIESAKASSARVWADRFKTPEELEIAYRHSSEEGYRLFQETRTHQEKMREYQARIAELEDQIKVGVAAPFKELSQKEVDDLRSADPSKYADYIVDLRFHKRNQEESLAKAKQVREDHQRSHQETARHINERVEQMASNPDIYPDFDSLKPVMTEILERTNGEVAGKRYTADLLYFAALGWKSLQAHREGNKASSEADKKAKDAAEAAARATGGSGAATSHGSGGSTDPLSDEAVIKAILGAAPKTFFK